MSKDPQNVVVTGGSGFIGTNLIDYLLEKGHSVINIDIRTPRKKSHLPYWKNVNILDYVELFEAIRGFNTHYIIHLAARTDLNERHDLNGYRVNIDGVKNVMEVAVKLPNLKRIIVASSMLVCKVGYIPTTFEEYCPNNLYGESKVITEKIVKEYNINWLLIRPTSIWGPWMGAPYLNFFKLVQNGIFFNIPARYASTKTYGYVRRSCDQIYGLMIAEEEAVRHKTFYIGDENSLNVTLWSHEIRSQLKKPNVITLPINALKIGARVGELLKKAGIKNFPLNEFRYRNMTTDNIIPYVRITETFMTESKSFDLTKYIEETLRWINKHSEEGRE